MRKLRKPLSWLLAVCMLFSLLPGTALAADPDPAPVADTTTYTDWEDLFGVGGSAYLTTKDIGRIWTDKSVSTQDIKLPGTTIEGLTDNTVKKEAGADFLVALSGLGSAATIVDETNNTFYNPVTNTTTNMNDWVFDYSDRSYTITTDNSTTTTVTYGDEYITIREGDTIYNIYYYVAQDQNPDQDTGCKHSYTSTVTTAATCDAPGLMTYTCSKCGDTYTEKIPATGHTWQVKQTVKTEYDEAGNVTQQGYTVYKCAICGTEYKDDAGTGPPSTPDNGDSGSGGIWDKLGNLLGSVVAGILSLIEAVFGKLLDSMISLAEMIAGKLKQVVELVLSFFDEIPTLFGGFLGFLSAVFPFIPDDIMLLLTFGIAAVVFIGIIKALRR